MPRVVHFEIPTDQPERAVKFYEDVFGWRIQKWDGPQDYWMINTGEDEPGINGALMQRNQIAATTVNSVDVASVDDFSERVTQNGGKVVAPKMSIPGAGYFAYCEDTEGNTFGIFQNDPSAQ